MKNKNRTKRRLLSSLFNALTNNDKFRYNSDVVEVSRKYRGSYIRIIGDGIFMLFVAPEFFEMFPVNKNGQNNLVKRKLVELYNETVPPNKRYHAKPEKLKLSVFTDIVETKIKKSTNKQLRLRYRKIL